MSAQGDEIMMSAAASLFRQVLLFTSFLITFLRSRVVSFYMFIIKFRISCKKIAKFTGNVKLYSCTAIQLMHFEFDLKMKQYCIINKFLCADVVYIFFYFDYNKII